MLGQSDSAGQPLRTVREGNIPRAKDGHGAVSILRLVNSGSGGRARSARP